MTVSSEFAGRVALITGAAGGIGAACARYFAARGATVVLADVDGDGLQAVAADIGSAGGDAHVVMGSVVDHEVVTSMVASARAHTGALDIALHFAGTPLDTPLDGPTAHIEAAVETNVLGAIWLVGAVLEPMRTQGRGRIVVSSSGIGALGLAGFGVHAACSAAAAGLVRSVALELAGTGVCINAVAPVADTEGAAALFAKYPHLDRRIFEAAHVATATALLCSDACTLNGELVSAEAGRVARIFPSTVPGWCDPVGDHASLVTRIDRIVSTDHAIAPRSLLDELLFTQV